MNPKARVWGGPLIASHVGADVAADLVAVGLDRPAATASACSSTSAPTPRSCWRADGRILAASCPAGPAFEGGSVTYGMQAAEGAIESVELDAGRRLRRLAPSATRRALGLCGSGLIDLLAVLGATGRMTPKGVFADRARTSSTCDAGAGITFSRADGSALAQAKAANTVGQWILLRELGVDPARGRPPLPRRRLRDLRRRAQRDRHRLPRARARSIASRRSATPRCAAPACCCSLPARARGWPS